VGVGFGIVDICAEYGERILPGEKNGVLKVVISTTG